MSAIAAINIGMKQLGFEEEDKRDLYERMTGERSLRAMNPNQKQAVLAELNRLGFEQKPGKSKLTGDYAPKLQALWLSAYNLGIVRDRTDKALLAFVKRQTGIDHTRFLHHQDDAAKAIEALKSWMTREADVNFSKPTLRLSNGGVLPKYLNEDRYRVAIAQIVILQKANKLDPSAKPVGLLKVQIGHSHLAFAPDASWIDLQKKMGRQIRGLVK